MGSEKVSYEEIKSFTLKRDSFVVYKYNGSLSDWRSPLKNLMTHSKSPEIMSILTAWIL